MVPTVTGQNAPTTKTPPTKRTHFFFQNKSLSKNNFCDSNVYKCLPAIRFCSDILFLCYYIFINLFIKIINLIHDDCKNLPGVSTKQNNKHVLSTYISYNVTSDI